MGCLTWSQETIAGRNAIEHSIPYLSIDLQGVKVPSLLSPVISYIIYCVSCFLVCLLDSSHTHSEPVLSVALLNSLRESFDMLPYFPLSWATALSVSLLCSPAVGLRPAINEIYRRDLFAAQREAETKLQKKDLICYGDAVLQAFQNGLDDTVPFCSSYLGITDLSSTSMVTAKTSEFLDNARLDIG